MYGLHLLISSGINIISIMFLQQVGTIVHLMCWMYTIAIVHFHKGDISYTSYSSYNVN